jgi:hypothetical protein
MALQDVGDALGNLVAGAVAGDDDVALEGDSRENRVMLSWRVYRS